jgi:cysteine desulfurase/selenocysteine lyase
MPVMPETNVNLDECLRIAREAEAAFDWRAAIAAYEDALLDYATRRVETIPGLRIVGTAPHKAAIVSFTLEGVHAHDVGTILDNEGIAVRAGHHCAMPVMERFGISGTARASFTLYNTIEEIDALATGIERVQRMFT